MNLLMRLQPASNALRNGFLLSTDASQTRLTQGLVEKELSLQFYDENRDSANSGIWQIATEVCLTELKDITVKALKRNSQQTLTGSSTSLVSPPVESSLTGRFTQLGLGGDMSTMRTIGQDVPREDWTMFVTFSKGYPVADWEIKEYFTGIFENA
ncbi:hypothetical protein K7X08_030994 [Anisodus acutangulus]|uniref:Uncharacterized protein n=1 Tax=Anisodus acutangulus TaxID=402998 RepID=A0A9Q1N0H8_9SOLA|nr:hypothetical protein K7X08_030994 [Anisodus acutangulus]